MDRMGIYEKVGKEIKNAKAVMERWMHGGAAVEALHHKPEGHRIDS
jgi:hypothetical protein